MCNNGAVKARYFAAASPDMKDSQFQLRMKHSVNRAPIRHTKSLDCGGSAAALPL